MLNPPQNHELYRYKNGSASVRIYADGTRIVDYEGKLILDYPLNIDIRVSTKCAFGYNPLSGKAVCDFCHESARTDGFDCNYNALQGKLENLPNGIELAVGANQLTEDLIKFLMWAKDKNYIVNITLNQGHINRDQAYLHYCINNDLIKGLGISYRSFLKSPIPDFILQYPHTVFHVITGIDDLNDVADLHKLKVKKLLILGEKDFGFNKNKVKLHSTSHMRWYQGFHKLFNLFEVVSFDNLAVEQLKVARFFAKEHWKSIYQGEFAMYIDAVREVFAPNSRSEVLQPWHDLTITDYFKSLPASGYI